MATVRWVAESQTGLSDYHSKKKKKSLSILFAEKVSFPNTKKSSLNVNVKCLFRNLLSAVRY